MFPPETAWVYFKGITVFVCVYVFTGKQLVIIRTSSNSISLFVCLFTDTVTCVNNGVVLRGLVYGILLKEKMQEGLKGDYLVKSLFPKNYGTVMLVLP